MKRADLSWALSAVLPHVGREHAYTDCVGITSRDSVVYVYGTDRYTTGIARLADGFGVDVNIRMTAKEATELERFVRTSYRDEESGTLTLAGRPGELHVGFDRQVHRDGTTELDTSVFDTIEHEVNLDYLLRVADQMYVGKPAVSGLVYRPVLAARFSKAQRADTDRMTFYPRNIAGAAERGAALVTVGSDFLGLIAGLAGTPEPSTVAGFLTAIRALERGAA